MITYSGVHIQAIGGAEGTPTAADIAVQSGRICRFGGAIWEPLLTHGVFVGLLAYRQIAHRTQRVYRSVNPSGLIDLEYATIQLLWGFLHDAHECATGEVPRNFKPETMRTEQAALDRRIKDKYLRQYQEAIDEVLIKGIDRRDACHIEGKVLGLPGYVELATLDNGTFHDNAEDEALFRRLLESQFYVDTTTASQSRGVVDFQNVLEAAEKGNLSRARELVLSWGLM